MVTIRHFLVALWLSGCAAAPPTKTATPAPPPSAGERAAAERAQKYGLDLPQATNTIGWPEVDVPHVALRGTQVLVDDALVDDVGELLASGRLKRVEGLFRALKRRSSAEAEGVVVFWFDAAAPALLVKSLFQTAAFAAFPNGSFAVRRAGTSQLGRLDADARVPGPPGLEGPVGRGDAFVLHVDFHGGKTQLVWKVGHQVVQTLDVPDGTFPTVIEEQWQRYGGHREAADQRFDQAVLHVDNQARFDAIIRLIDLINGPRRDFAAGGVSEHVPAFNVTFAIN